MVKQDIIEPSVSPWNSNIVLGKKSDNTWRFCIDFRLVNDCVSKFSYPLPRIDALSGAKYFSTVDLKSGYYQIPVAKNSIFLPRGGVYGNLRECQWGCLIVPLYLKG